MPKAIIAGGVAAAALTPREIGLALASLGARARSSRAA
jgi:hypothetical protein